MDTTEFVDLIDFKLNHDFYENSSVFELKPTIFTRNLFKRYNIIYKITTTGFRLNIKSSFKDVFIKDVKNNLLELFTFNIEPRELDLVKVSVLPRLGILDYYTLSVSLDSNEYSWDVQRAKSQTNVISPNNNSNPWALLCLDLKSENLESENFPIKLKTRLNANSVFWKYIVIDSKNQFDEIFISSTSNDDPFHESKPMKLADGNQGLVFLSKEKLLSVDNFSGATFELELVKVTDGSRRKSTLALPVAAIKDYKYQNHPSGSSNDKCYIAQMYVYL